MSQAAAKFPYRALAAAIALAVTASVDAAFYSGNLDPNANPPVPAFNGYATFDINTASCPGPGVYAGSVCLPAFVTAATIYLYGNGTSQFPGITPGIPPGSGSIDMLTLGSPGFINSFVLGPGSQLLALDTGAIQLTGNNNYAGTFWLDFDYAGSVPGGRPIPSTSSVAYLLYDPRGGESPGNALRSNPAAVIFCSGLQQPCSNLTTVPEPRSIALVLASLLAALGVHRRRRPS